MIFLPFSSQQNVKEKTKRISLLVVSTPLKKKMSNWKASPGRDENKKYLKPPPRKGFPMEFLFAYTKNLLLEHVSKKKIHKILNHYRSIFAHVFSPMLTNEKDAVQYPCMLHVCLNL